MHATTRSRRFASAAVIVAAGHLSLELCHNFLPIVYPLFISEYGFSYTQIGAIALVASVGSTVLQPVFGYLADRFDPRLLVLFSLAWVGAIMGLVGLARSYLLILTVVAVGSLGSAAFHPAAASLAAAATSRRRGASMSLFAVGGSVGAALSPLLVGAALLQFGLPGTLILVPVILLLAGFLFYHRQKLPVANTLVEHRQRVPGAVTRGPWMALILVVLVAAARSWYYGGLSTYLPEWLQGQGWSPERASSALSMLILSVSVGSLAGGTISDRFGRVPVLLFALVSMVPVQWLLLNSTGWLQTLSLLFAGALIGATLPVTLVMAQEAWPRAVGLASSLAIGFGWLPAGIGSWTIGMVADRASLTAGLSTLMFVPVIGVGAVLLFHLRYRAPVPA